MVALSQFSGVAPLAVAAPLVVYAGREVGSQTAFPDVYGRVTYEGRVTDGTDASSLRTRKNPCRNTLYCDFENASLSAVKMQHGDRIRVVLHDADRLDQDDTIASVSLTPEDIVTAATLGGDVFVPFREETGDRLFGVIISARRTTAEFSG